METLSVQQARQPENIGKTVQVRGWVRSRRDSKAGFSFIDLNDGSCFGNIQILASKELSNYEQTVLAITTGCSISVIGTVNESAGKGQATEIQASEITLLGAADVETYPLQKKQHSLEFLRTIAHLRPRTNTFGAVARVRNRISFSIHQFFQEEGFYYLHSPILTASDCEGAGEMFRVSTLSAENPPRTEQGKIDYSQDFFGRSVFLTVSGQLEAETYACGLGKVYTFGPTFRAENSNTSRHLSEFWMVEPEVAFYELPDNMDLAERFLKRIFGDILKDCPEDMQFFNDRIDNTLIETLEHVVSSGFIRLPYTEAIEILKASNQKFEFKVDWGTDLQSEHERYLTEVHFKKPVILYDYPKQIKSFYMRLNDDEKTVRAMDVLVPKIGEIIGGSEREYRLDVLEKRMKELGLAPENYWWYTDLRRYGTVPHSGFGLGLERAVMYGTAIGNIRDVIPFPRFPGHCEF